jgi:hypothetical protein
MSALARCLERFGHGRCVRLKRAIGSLTRSAPYRPAQLRKLSSPTKRFEASEKIAMSPPWRVGPAWPAFSEGGGWIAKKMHVRSSNSSTHQLSTQPLIGSLSAQYAFRAGRPAGGIRFFLSSRRRCTQTDSELFPVITATVPSESHYTY